jgi:hypothetical protein
MLHCNMEPVMDSQWGLSNLLADLQHARQQGDLGRLAFVSYCDVRRWARDAGQPDLADLAARLVTESPHPSRVDFLNQIDQLIQELEDLRLPAQDRQASHQAESMAWANARRVA